MSTSFALVPDSQSNESHTLTIFALDPDSQPTVAINRGQATTVLSEHRNKEQRKVTTVDVTSVFRLKTTSAVLWQCGWSSTNEKGKNVKKRKRSGKKERNGENKGGKKRKKRKKKKGEKGKTVKKGKNKKKTKKKKKEKKK